MLVASNESTLTSLSPLSTVKDPLGLTPIPVDHRERFLRFALSQQPEPRAERKENRKQDQTENVLLPLSEVVEVMQLALEDIFPVPGMPESILGVCSWRGETLWLVDLNHLTGYTPLYERSYLVDSPFVIVVQSLGRSLGLVVEAVGEVALFDANTIQMEPGLCSPTLEPFVQGYCPQQGGTVLSAAKMIESSIWHASNTSGSC